jgi:hypothetical protein
VASVQDADLYRRLLGVEPPWKVDRVDLDIKGERVDVYLEHTEGALWGCPECGQMLSVSRTPVDLYNHVGWTCPGG